MEIRPQEVQELLARLDIIEQQARLALQEFPREIRKERQRLIIALVEHIRTAATDPQAGLPVDPEATIKLRLP